MNIEWHHLGDKLVAAGAHCKRDMVLVAPFMKAETLKKIIENLTPSASLLCLTRWRLEEIALGVSDLECWDIISTRENSRLLLRQNLHAKYFRFDDSTYLGSANLTMTALGWSARPNSEVLIEFSTGDVESSIAFEESLFVDVVDVTEKLVDEFKALLKTYPILRQVEDHFAVYEKSVQYDVKGGATAQWLPSSRSPEYLYSVYIGDKDAMSKDGLVSAREDLRELDLPPGLPESVFYSLVRSRLTTNAIVVKLNHYLAIRRRFGEIRCWMESEIGLVDATDAWQRLMRWLLFYFPDRYEAITPNYSELFGKK